MSSGVIRMAIATTDEYKRVLSLPTRPELTESFKDALSKHLSLAPGVSLRDSQVSALREFYDCGGLFAPMRVGSGKTLVTLLAPALLGAKDPVLILPASLIEKTRREFAQYRRHWNVQLPHLVSYSEVGHPRNEHRLLELNPDVLMLDEAHKARNLSASCTRRIGRAIDLLRPKVAALSGTLITDDLMDYWHILLWCLGENAPVPTNHGVAEHWAQSLSEGGMKGFYEHMREVRGVVPTPGKDCDASIEISTWETDLPQAIIDAAQIVSEAGMRPDGELLEEWEAADYLCQLAQGFWYTWDPLPPKWWLEPRRNWNKYVREVLELHLEGFDSPSMVVNALDRKSEEVEPPNAKRGRLLLKEWRAVRDKFTPNTVPVWINDAPLQQVVREAEGLIWTRHRAAGERLRKLGIPYYGAGSNPEAATEETIALSIAAHGAGRNLQRYDRALILTPPATSDPWEQIIGRIHRQGQKSDVVSVSVYEAFDYHRSAVGRVRQQSHRVSDASGFGMKVSEATWV